MISRTLLLAGGLLALLAAAAPAMADSDTDPTIRRDVEAQMHSAPIVNGELAPLSRSDNGSPEPHYVGRPSGNLGSGIPTILGDDNEHSPIVVYRQPDLR